jgi:hypothetical protein
MVVGQNVFAGKSQVEQLRAKLQGEAPRLRTGRTDAFARGFEAAVSRALEREPESRYASADEMIAALSGLRGLRGVAGSRTSVTRRRVMPASPARPMRHHALWAMGALALCACGAFGAARRTSAASPAPLVEAVATSQPHAVVASAAGEVEGPSDQQMCSTGPAPSTNQIAPVAKNPTPVVQRPADGPARSQRSHDGDLMKAIRSAVQEEAYMTLSIPDPDLMPVDRLSRRVAPSADLTVARR